MTHKRPGRTGKKNRQLSALRRWLISLNAPYLEEYSIRYTKNQITILKQKLMIKD